MASHPELSLQETPSVANLLDSSPGMNDSALLPPPSSERTPPSTSLTSPLALARELAARLGKQQNEPAEAWRLACALSLSIVDLLESVRASDTMEDSADLEEQSSVTRRDPFTR
jgi:hypothetical protein